MVYEKMNINSLNDELIAEYFPLLSSGRQQKIVSLNDVKERSVLFCSEILARRCLSRLCDAPEFSFSLLCNPDSKSVVTNFDAEISVVRSGDVIVCAVSRNYVGAGIVPICPFSFIDAQKKLSDVELRAVFSDSLLPFSELINLSECTEKEVIKKYALISSLKNAAFNASGRFIRSDSVKTDFEFSGNEILSTDVNYRILEAFIDEENSVAISIIEREKS